MTRRLAVALAAVALATAGVAAEENAAGAQKKAKAAATGKSFEMQKAGFGQATSKRVEKLSAKVKAVDVPARTIALQAADGAVETFKVSPDVKRLDEVHAGDDVVLTFEQSVILQYQQPGEKDVVPEGYAAAERAGADQAPGAHATAQVRSTVTAVAVDPKARIVVFEGPLGNLYKVKAGKDINLAKVKAGQKYLAIYSETLAVNVQKAPAAAAAKPASTEGAAPAATTPAK